MAIRTGSATSNGSFSSLSISGTTSMSGNMSWSLPTLPDGATILSTSVTYTLDINTLKGSATVTINGDSVEDGTGTLDLGTTTRTSVSVTARGGNRNTNGTVSISNIVYTINYQYDDGTIATYTVRFLDWNGNVLKTETVEEGSSATAPTNPTRTGYTFTGWDKAFTNVTSDLTVTAQYTINSYTVTFKDWDGSTLKTQTVNHGSNATPPSNPVRDGYTFTGWSGNYNNITSNVDIVAQYEEIPKTRNLYIGSNVINNIYLGETKIAKVYIGDNLIYEG